MMLHLERHNGGEDANELGALCLYLIGWVVLDDSVEA